jgi:hypothetical protein
VQKSDMLSSSACSACDDCRVIRHARNAARDETATARDAIVATGRKELVGGCAPAFAQHGQKNPDPTRARSRVTATHWPLR